MGRNRKGSRFSLRRQPGRALTDNGTGVAPAIAARGGDGVAAPVAIHHSLQPGERLDNCFALHARPVSVLARATVQESHKPVALAAGLPAIGWHSFRHTVSAWGKEAGLELEDVKTLLRHEDIATTSNVYGDMG